MVTKKTIVLLLGAILLLPVLTFAKGVPQTYVIRKGDTLWGVSQRFLKDPDYWPNLWSNNPFVTNPHLIYPGQEIAIYDGRILVVGEKKTPSEGPVVVDEKIAEDTITIKTFGGADGFISEKALQGLGTIIDAVDNRLLMAKDDTLFIQMNEPADIGDLFLAVRADKAIHHPRTGAMLGYRVMDLGTVQIREINPSVATGVVTESYREIKRGDRIISPHLREYHIDLKKAANPLSGFVVAATNDQEGLASYDVIHVDLGAADGLEPGNLLYLARERKVTNKALVKKAVDLPDIFLGEAVVLETQEHTSAVLILKCRETVFVGDKVFTVIR
jgi:hypothetical protein